MAYVGGHLWRPAFDVNSRLIPIHQRVHSKAVTKIMHVGTFCSRRSWQANRTRNPQELPFCSPNFRAVAIIHDEECRCRSFRVELIAMPPIDREFMYGGRMNRNQPRFAPFASSNRQHAFGQIDIRIVEIHAFA